MVENNRKDAPYFAPRANIRQAFDGAKAIDIYVRRYSFKETEDNAFLGHANVLRSGDSIQIGCMLFGPKAAANMHPDAYGQPTGWTEGTHILIRKYGPKPGQKTNTYKVYAKEGGAELGRVVWFPAWRKYSYEPTLERRTWYEETCMREIADFCVQETAARRIERAAEKGNL